MKRIRAFIYIIVFAVAIICIIIGNTICKTDNSEVAIGAEKNVQYNRDENGNTPGNIVNRGYAASIGSNIVYQDSYYFDLRLLSSDGNSDTILSRDSVYADNINVAGDWIYFCDSLDNFNIYRMYIDGSKMEKLTDYKQKCNTQYIIVTEDWIYYCRGTDSKYGMIYKMRIDGSENTQISYDKAKDINVTKDWIYYINNYDNDRIYRMKTDGSLKELLTQDSADNLVVDGERIFYINLSNSSGLYKTADDGSSRTVITQDKVSCLNVSDDFIYYSNISDSWKLYRIKKDGTQRVKISDDDPVNINIFGDWIYYSRWNNYFNIYRIKTDGSKKETIR